MNVRVLKLLNAGSVLPIGALIFLSAGRLDLPQVWAWLSIVLALTLVGLYVLPLDPDLLRERLRPGGGRSVALTLTGLVGLGLTFGHLIVAGLDIGRLHASHVPGAVELAALAVLALGNGLALWAMYVNRFFSSVIRIQKDRGQRVIMEGPYRFIRHPAYAAFLFVCVANGPALGSWWAMPFSLLGIPALLVRTAAEDRVLLRELPGYAEYAARVRYRLIPGLW